MDRQFLLRYESMTSAFSYFQFELDQRICKSTDCITQQYNNMHTMTEDALVRHSMYILVQNINQTNVPYLNYIYLAIALMQLPRFYYLHFLKITPFDSMT